MRRALPTAALLCALMPPARGQEVRLHTPAPSASPADADEQLAQELNNPLANLISVPIQNNFDYGGGRNDRGYRYTMLAQPVLPFKLSDNLNLITRTVIPYAHLERIFPNHESGLGDIVQSAWFSPAIPTSWGLTWGVGPAVLYPTATNGLIGGRQWAAGPTAVGVVTRGPWIGLLLANQLWSLGGAPDARREINQTFVQAALAYTTPARTTLFASTESTYDYTSHRGTVPLQLGVNQLVRVGRVPFQVGGLGRYYIDTPPGGPKWGFQLRVTFVFPK